LTQEQKLCFAWKIFSKESFSYFKEIVDQKIKDHIPEVEILAMNLSSAINFHKKYYNNFKLYLKLKV